MPKRILSNGDKCYRLSMKNILLQKVLKPLVKPNARLNYLARSRVEIASTEVGVSIQIESPVV